jgi:hypothetical protein
LESTIHAQDQAQMKVRRFWGGSEE